MARLIFLEPVNNINIGALIGIGALTLEGGAYSKEGAYIWKEGAKSNHYGIPSKEY